MKKVILFVGAIALSIAMNAQINVGANFLVGLPTGDWGDAYNTGFGGGIEGNYFVTDEIAVGLEINFLSFGVNDAGIPGFGGISPFRMTPISIKGEYYFMDDEFKPFAGIGMGIYSMKQSVSVPFFGNVESKSTNFGISPRIGAIYQVSDEIGIVLNINYNLVFVEGGANFVGINIGARYTIAD